MAHKSRTASNTLAETIVLCCTEQARPQLTPALELLGARGYGVEVVSGIDTDPPRALLDVARKHGVAGIYIVCSGNGLPDERIDRLREMLGALNISSQRIVKVALDWRRPLEAFEAVERTLGQVRDKRPRSRSRAPVKGPPAPPRLGTTLPPPGGTAHAHPPPAGRTPARGVAPPIVVPEISATTGSVHEVVASAVAAPSASGTGLRPAASAETFPSAEIVGTEALRGQADQSPPSGIAAGGFAGRVPRTGSGDPSGRVPAAPRSERAHPHSAPEPSLRVPTIKDVTDDARRQALDDLRAAGIGLRRKRFGHRPLWIGGTTAVVVLIGLIAWPDDPPAEPQPELREVAASVQAAQPEPSLALAERVRDIDDPGDALAIQEIDGGAPTEKQPVVDPSLPAPEDQPSANKETFDEPTDLAEAEDDPEPIDDDQEATLRDHLSIVNAAARQELRILDLLVVAPEPRVGRKMRRTKTMNLEGAERYCAELSIAGVGQWRLPTVGELSTLSHNLIIGPRGLFWSSTDADAFGNQRLVWNAKARRLFASSSKWRGGRIVCVRDHGPPEEASESGTDERPDE